MNVSAPKLTRTRNYRLRQWWRHDDYRLISERQAFQASNLRGASHHYVPAPGRLPHEWVRSFRRSTYAVWSYATPIAWWSATDGWVLPDVKYSQSTSVHQSTVSLALSAPQRVAS